MNSAHQSEILIVGAGPGGCTCALLLAQNGIPVTIIDKSSFPRDKICGDALSGKVISVFKKLDIPLLDHFYEFEEKRGSYGVRFVAPNRKSLDIPFKKDISSLRHPPGFISKRIEFDNFLIEAVKKQELITLIEGTSISSYEQDETGWKLAGPGNTTFRTRLLIAADGAQSAFYRHISKKKSINKKHISAGIRQYFKNVKGIDANNFVELHFIKDTLPGYLWIFGLPNGEANVGVGMRSDVVSQKKVNLPDMLTELLKSPSLQDRFSEAIALEKPKGYSLPLGSEKRKLYGRNYILLGDAGALIDPFTGEGISNAMLSGMYAAEAIAGSYPKEFSSIDILKKYQDRVYKRLGNELRISTILQKLLNYPFLFNLVVRKANHNRELKELIISMFDNVDLRKKFSDPFFYLRMFRGR